MEPFDQQLAHALEDNTSLRQSAAEPARIMVVTGDLTLRGNLAASLAKRSHHCTAVGSLSEARSSLSRNRFDLIVLCWKLPDGGGLDLAPLVQKISPSTKIIVLAEGMAADIAVHAMRCGAVDCLSLPLNLDDLLRRIEPALLKSRAERHRDERLHRLKKVCRELNIARHEISKQVDTLCDDLSNAYREIADQMSDVALASEFRTLLKQELDVEDLLRTTLQYLLTKTGPTNAAVFLPEGPGVKLSSADHQHYGLGAYVNYDCPRESIATLLDHLGRAICPQMEAEPEIVSFTDSSEFSEWVGDDLANGGAAFFANSHVIAFSCLHKNQCLAVIVLFRNKNTPFDEKLASTIDTMRQIIGEQLSNVIKVHQRARPSWPKEAEEGDLDYHDDDLGFGGYEGGMAA